jgi:hypothetical protein
MTSNENNAPDINLDEFLPMPGAPEILTAPEESEKPNSVFSKPAVFNTDFLEKKDVVKNPEEKTEEGTKEEEKVVDLDAIKDVVDEIVNIDEEPKTTPGRPKIDKSGLVDTFSKLIDEGLLVPFDDDKPMDQYSMKDWKELLQANFEDRENKVRQEVPQSFFESLPDELKYAYKYIADGGQDLKGLFKALSHVEEVRELNPSSDRDQEVIARQYLRATKFGTEDEISAQIEEWKDVGTLQKKANQFKPRLDEMQQQVVEYQLKKQEEFVKQREQMEIQYMGNVYNTINKGDLNGIKLEPRIQQFLYEEMTNPKYVSHSNGTKTNLLGYLLEHYQFVEPRYDLVAEAMWLLADPDGYKQRIKSMGKNEATQETVRKLKTEESRKISTSVQDEPEDEKPAKRKLPRQQNIFKR